MLVIHLKADQVVESLNNSAMIELEEAIQKRRKLMREFFDKNPPIQNENSFDYVKRMREVYPHNHSLVFFKACYEMMMG